MTQRPPKQRTEQHIIDQRAQDIFRRLLPKSWVLHEYRPDYGIDFVLEIFEEVEKGGKTLYQTLGEHLFIQLKGTESLKTIGRTIYSRRNAEKGKLTEDKEKVLGVAQVVPFPLDTSELVTVERMGHGTPVMLVVVDVSTEEAFYVCLNDYLDKVLIPEAGRDYATAGSRTIHIPTWNKLNDPVGEVGLRWYAKRQKLLAGFQRFAFQFNELRYSTGTDAFKAMAEYFAATLLKLDFWDNTEMWPLLRYYWLSLKSFVDTGAPGTLPGVDDKVIRELAGDDETATKSLIEELRQQSVVALWEQLHGLSWTYEDMSREWFLPTPLGFLTRPGIEDGTEEVIGEASLRGVLEENGGSEKPEPG